MSFYAHEKFLVKVIRVIEEDGLYTGMYGESLVKKGDLVVRDGAGYEYPVSKSEFDEVYAKVSKETKSKEKKKRSLSPEELLKMATGYGEMGEIIKQENEARDELHIELTANKAL